MTTESETKKPPAHEVIVRRIEAFHSRLEDCADRLSTLFNSTLPTHTAPGKQMLEEAERDCAVITAQTMVLIEVLVTMHIPQEARANVVRVLRLLPSQCFPRTIERVFAEIEGDARGA